MPAYSSALRDEGTDFDIRILNFPSPTPSPRQGEEEGCGEEGGV
jgi:hypothetical protein